MSDEAVTSSDGPAGGMLALDGEILGEQALVVLEPETWIGRRFPLLAHIDASERLRAGRWLVVLYHHDCPRCQTLLKEYGDSPRWRDGAGRQLALVEVPPFARPALRAPHQNATAAALRGRLSDERQWFVQTPARIELDDGVVVGVRRDD